jgi:hypothetical protein
MMRALQGAISGAGVDLISYVHWISVTKYDYDIIHTKHSLRALLPAQRFQLQACWEIKGVCKSTYYLADIILHFLYSRSLEEAASQTSQDERLS